MDIWMGLMAILTLATIGALMNLGNDMNNKNGGDDNNHKRNSDSDFWKYL